MCQVVIYKRLKMMDKISNCQPRKVVAAARKRWLFTRACNCEALSRKILVFWMGGYLWEVVAYQRWLCTGV